MNYAHNVSGGEIRRALGELLRGVRESGRRTLTEVAGEAGISPAHLSEVERGLKDISTDLLVAVTHALGVPAADVYLELGRRLDDARAGSAAAAWPQDPRRQLRLATASLPDDALRSLAHFSAYLTTAQQPKPRIGFVTGDRGR
jgi:transcriptional regulator with XRE-family HTH domain